MISPKHTLLLIVILSIASIFFVTADGFGMSWEAPTQTLPIHNIIVDGFGMSPGTLDQLQSTSVRPMSMPYLIF